MAQTKTKKDIVKMLLKNRQLDDKSEAELMELLFDEPIAIDVDKMASESETLGDKIADKVTEICGSWTFIITFVIALIAWMGINVYLYNKNGSSFDAYPFILLNLVLSCVAALQAPIIMMSQNRSAKKDTLRGKNDYKTDLKSELILEELHDEMTKIISNQNKILKIINKDENEKS